MNEADISKAYAEMKKMSLSELYNLREIAITKNKLNFLKLVDYAIKMRNQDKINQMIV